MIPSDLTLEPQKEKGNNFKPLILSQRNPNKDMMVRSLLRHFNKQKVEPCKDMKGLLLICKN